MLEKFKWTSNTGTEIVLPRMDQIKAGVLRKHRKEDPVDFMFSIVEAAADDDTLAKLDDLDVNDLNACFEAWQAEVSPGESGRSSN